MKIIVLIITCMFLTGCVVTEHIVFKNETTKEVIIKQNITEEEDVEMEDEFYQAGKALRWDHMPVTYRIMNEEECGGYESRKIQKGFDLIENATGAVVSFMKIEDGEADIEVSCSFIEDCYEKKVDVRAEEGVVYKYETICAHDRGRAQITKLIGDKILKARIEMIGLAGFAETGGTGSSGFFIGSCGHTTTEIHEILHTFGYGHISDPKSIMYYKEDGIGYTIQDSDACAGSKKDIDKEIIEDLIRIYRG